MTANPNSHEHHEVVQLGLALLRDGSVSTDNFSDAFSLLSISDTELHLAALKSPFDGDKFFEPKPLDSPQINYPSLSETDVAKNNFSKVNPGDGKISLTALERYGTFVATNANDKISVYDLFKSAAAIQDCLIHGKKEKPFLLVSSGFSGIQDTVYTISSKGALKTLRARSFMLEMLTEHIVYEILTAADAGRHAIIYSGGGGFSLLLPNKEATVEGIKKYKDVLSRWCYKEFSAKLFIGLDSLECDLRQESLATLRAKQNWRMENAKRRKFLNEFSFVDENKQQAGLFVPKMPEQHSNQLECQITRRDDLPNSKMRDLENGQQMPDENPDLTKTWVSESSFHHFKLGDKLIDVKMIYRFEEQPVGNGYLTFKGINNRDIYYSVENNGNSVATWAVNSWANTSPTILYADYVRTIEQLRKKGQAVEKEVAHEENRNYNESNTATFDGLAACSCGANLIGSLRMDVDDMGKLFGEIETLWELSTKSRMLNLFFKVYLNEICRAKLNGDLEPTNIVEKKYAENNGRNVSVIYAGGDDLFILGAWDETAELAFDIQRCFALFTGGTLNPEKQAVTGGCGISGGLTLHQPKFPLYQMARKSGEAEHVAKHDKDSNHDDEKKNRIALFHDHAKNLRKSKMQNSESYMLSMTWDLSNEFLLPLMRKYRKCGELKEQDGKLVFEIDKFSYQTIEKWFAVIKKYQESNQLYLPTMARVMAQVEEMLGENEHMLFKDLLGFLYTGDKKKKNWISHLHIALNWLSYLRRTT